jgi:hypothetical protein
MVDRAWRSVSQRLLFFLLAGRGAGLSGLMLPWHAARVDSDAARTRYTSAKLATIDVWQGGLLHGRSLPSGKGFVHLTAPMAVGKVIAGAVGYFRYVPNAKSELRPPFVASSAALRLSIGVGEVTCVVMMGGVVSLSHGSASAGASASYSNDPEQLVEIDWFYKMDVDPRFAALFIIRVLPIPCDRNDVDIRETGELANRPCGIVAIHARQSDIQYDDIRPERSRAGNCIRAIDRQTHVIAFDRQRELQHARRIDVVFDHQIP